MSCQLRVAPLASCTAAAAAGLLVWWWKSRRSSDTFDLARLVRPCVLAAAPYGFPIRYGYDEPLLLDMNESSECPLDESVFLKSLQLHRYPDPRQTQLKRQFAALRSTESCTLAAEQIVFGCGSDELIELLIRTTCTPGRDSIMICSPTYAMYAVFARHNDVGVVDIPLTDDFQLDLPSITRVFSGGGFFSRRVKLVFLCSPGNPTGCLLRRADVLAIAAAARHQALVVADEAYIDFSSDDASCVSAIESAPNLVVSQTLSKAWGLAGLRVGILLANKPLVSILERVKAPFNLSSVAEVLALTVLSKRERVFDRVRSVISERARVSSALDAFPAVRRIFASDANFLLVRVDGCEQLCKDVAADANLMLRYRGQMRGCTDCVRISIGSVAENDAMLEAVQHALRKRQGRQSTQ